MLAALLHRRHLTPATAPDGATPGRIRRRYDYRDHVALRRALEVFDRQSPEQDVLRALRAPRPTLYPASAPPAPTPVPRRAGGPLPLYRPGSLGAPAPAPAPTAMAADASGAPAVVTYAQGRLEPKAVLAAPPSETPQARRRSIEALLLLMLEM